MGFFYLINCLALATGPHFILYKECGMKEHDAFWRCFKVLLLYGFTQLLRMFLATFVSFNFDISSPAGLFNYEVIGAFLNFGAVRFVYSFLIGRSELSLYIGGIGWSCGDLVFTKYIPIWVGTKGLEFDWSYLWLSFDANIELIFTFILFFVPWLLMRREKNVSATYISFLIYTVASFHLSIFGWIERKYSDPITILLVKIAIALSAGFLGLVLKVTWTTEAAFESKRSSSDASIIRRGANFLKKYLNIAGNFSPISTPTEMKQSSGKRMGH